MIRKLATLWAYKKAPKATYIARHPVKGTKLWLAAKGTKSLVKGKVGVVLGTLAAIPVGLWAKARLTA